MKTTTTRFEVRGTGGKGWLRAANMQETSRCIRGGELSGRNKTLGEYEVDNKRESRNMKIRRRKL